MQTDNTRGIYIHIPFCMSKCPYCDFYSVPGAKPEKIEAFAAALENEIDFYAQRYAVKPIESVYFGGGTPGLLSENRFESLMDALRTKFRLEQNAEVSMEVNPAAVTEDKLRSFRKAGLNRLSIGAQSFDDKVLKILGRIHKAEQIRETVTAARNAGIDNLSLDLMFGISGQPLESWEKSVEAAIAARPEHLSLYSLEIMDNTRFARDCDKGIYRQTTEEADRKMYKISLEMMDTAGYRQYEISNAAKPGYECRHNLRYWSMGEYMGLGPSAHSFLNGTRYANIPDVDAYILSGGRPEVRDYTVNTQRDNISEYIFTGLRKTAGIDKADFRDKFGGDIWDFYPEEKREFTIFVNGGFAEEDATSLRLTRRGMDISNKIMMIFV